jgi:hypothetical protein
MSVLSPEAAPDKAVRIKDFGYAGSASGGQWFSTQPSRLTISANRGSTRLGGHEGLDVLVGCRTFDSCRDS